MNGAKRCVVICKACHPVYQAKAYALELALFDHSDAPQQLLLAWADLCRNFAGGSQGNLPQRWLDWYDAFVTNIRTSSMKSIS
jgi:hypothetical protein